VFLIPSLFSFSTEAVVGSPAGPYSSSLKGTKLAQERSCDAEPPLPCLFAVLVVVAFDVHTVLLPCTVNAVDETEMMLTRMPEGQMGRSKAAHPVFVVMSTVCPTDGTWLFRHVEKGG